METRFENSIKTVRVTLISDPSNEYPDNKNNAFQVRLPVPLNLEGQHWYASLWNVSLPDVGHSPSVLQSKSDTKILNYRYTLTKRSEVNYTWSVTFDAKDKSVVLKDVMSSTYPVVSGRQLWQNILTHMDQTMMDDVKSTSDAWKKTHGNESTVSLKSSWKPTFEWNDDTLVLKKVDRQDAYTRDSKNVVQPLSAVGIHVDLAKKFGLVVQDKKKDYQLGPNLNYVLPTTTYTDESQPQRSNSTYQWLGDHFTGIKPHDLGGDAIFKVKQVSGQSYLYLSRAVDWHIHNLDALFNTHVGSVKQSVLIYCNAVKSTVVGDQRHPLLRKVEMERKGEGRATIEPYHREWVKVRQRHIESIEVSLAKADGSLLVLPPGKTILTLGFQQV